MEDRRFGFLSSLAIKAPVQIVSDVNVKNLRGLQTLTASLLSGNYESITSEGDRVLLLNQDDKRQNGIWLASRGWWMRAPDFNGSLDAVNGTLITSVNGDIWRVVSESNNVVISVSEIEFKAVYELSTDILTNELFLRKDNTSDDRFNSKNQRIANLADPVNDQDAVNLITMKSYVDTGNPDFIDKLSSESGSSLVGYSNNLTLFDGKIKDIIDLQINNRPTLKMFGVITDGVNSSVDTLVNALTLARNAGITTVYADDDDILLIDKQFVMPSYMVIKGNSHPESRNKTGAELRILHGKNPTDPVLEASIILNIGSGFDGFYVNYPEQVEATAEEPIPYSWTFTTSKLTTGSSANTDGVHLKNLFIKNAYRAIDLTNSAQFLVENIYGQPIFMGIQVDSMLDVSRIRVCHFWPFTFNSSSNMYKWILSYGTAYLIARADGIQISDLFAYGYNIGFKFTKGSWITGKSLVADICRHCLVIDSCNTINLSGLTLSDTHGDPLFDITGGVARSVSLSDVCCYGSPISAVGYINTTYGVVQLANIYNEKLNTNDTNIGIIVDGESSPVYINGPYGRIIGAGNVFVNGVRVPREGENALQNSDDINNLTFYNWSDGLPVGWSIVSNATSDDILQIENGCRLNFINDNLNKIIEFRNFNAIKNSPEFYLLSFDLDTTNLVGTNIRFSMRLCSATGAVITSIPISVTDNQIIMKKKVKIKIPMFLGNGVDQSVLSTSSMYFRISWTGYGSISGFMDISNLTIKNINRDDYQFIDYYKNNIEQTIFNGDFRNGIYNSTRVDISPDNAVFSVGDILTISNPSAGSAYQAIYTGDGFITKDL